VLAGACVLSLQAASPVRVQIVFDSYSAATREILTRAVDEAARIWKSYGVDLSERLDQAGAGISLAIDLDTIRQEGIGEDGLGQIHFRSDGSPDSSVTLFYAPIVRLASNATRMSPISVRNQIVARVMGRALAHEVGHFLLRSPHHAARGLMRAGHHASALTDSSRKGFVLTDSERDRLRIVLNSPLLATAPPSALPAFEP
jgi:hypothetical protein